MSSGQIGNSIFVVNSATVPAVDFDRSGAVKVKVQHLIGEGQRSKWFALRLYTIEKGGHTPVDQHEYEHQAYILKGHGILRKEGVRLPLRPRDAVFIPSNTVHQFTNERGEPFVYLLLNIL